jgi:sugar phosphate isomerase/epimerase
MRPERPLLTRTFSTLGCAELGWDEIWALAARHGFQELEFRAVAGATALPGWFGERFGSPAQMAADLAARGTRIRAFGTSFRLIDGSEADRSALLAYAPWAEAAGVPWLRVFDGGKTGDAAEIARAVETLAWWGEERRRHGWKTELMVETHDALVTTPVLRAFFEAAPRAALLWDSHHTWRKGGEDPVDTWRVVGGRTVHVHVKDSVGRPSGNHPFTYVLPGEGEFPMKRVLDALKRDGFSGAISLEWERLWHPYLAGLDVALSTAAERRWW